MQILSPHILSKSCLAGRKKLKEWLLVQTNEAGGNVLRFSTIRSFKGMEADIYVGGSRARYMLYIFNYIGMSKAKIQL